MTDSQALRLGILVVAVFTAPLGIGVGVATKGDPVALLQLNRVNVALNFLLSAFLLNLDYEQRNRAETGLRPYWLDLCPG